MNNDINIKINDNDSTNGAPIMVINDFCIGRIIIRIVWWIIQIRMAILEIKIKEKIIIITAITYDDYGGYANDIGDNCKYCSLCWW